MKLKSPLRSTQSSSTVRVFKSFDAVTHTPVMPWQHLSQLGSEPARQSARSAAVANLAAHAAPSPRSQQPVEPHGATRPGLPALAEQYWTLQRAGGHIVPRRSSRR